MLDRSKGEPFISEARSKENCPIDEGSCVMFLVTVALKTRKSNLCVAAYAISSLRQTAVIFTSSYTLPCPTQCHGWNFNPTSIQVCIMQCNHFSLQAGTLQRGTDQLHLSLQEYATHQSPLDQFRINTISSLLFSGSVCMSSKAKNPGLINQVMRDRYAPIGHSFHATWLLPSHEQQNKPGVSTSHYVWTQKPLIMDFKQAKTPRQL